MRIGLTLLTGVLFSALAVGCSEPTFGYMDCPGPQSVDVEEDTGGGDDAAADLAEVGPVAGSWAGTPCSGDADCAAGACYSSDTFAEAGLIISDVPGSMCTLVDCQADAECGDGGVCGDVSAFSGEFPKICLQPCGDLADCRWQEGYSCLTADGKENPGDGGLCLPDAILTATALPPPGVGWVGSACESHNDCNEGKGVCVTKQYLEEDFELVIDGLEIPNGMCSMLLCGTDDHCGEGGICYNTEPFSGEKLNICLQSCTVMTDCRWLEGYSCYVEDPADESGVCLPDSLVVEIICDDGHCDEEVEQ